MKTRRLAPFALALLIVTGGCGGDGDDVAGGPPSSSSGVGAPQATPAATPPATPPATASPQATAATPTAAATADASTVEPFPATTGVDTEASSGGPLSVVAMRVARQEGYDRVVFELKGKQAGQPGWRVEYTNDPRQDGSGDPVVVKGAAKLSVVITGVGIPFDTGVPETTADPVLPPGLGVLQDVQFSSNFEGQYTVFVGARSATPFRVFRLSDPARVVVDLRHS